MFKLDTHVHTSEVSPCGQVSAADTVDLYQQAGYDGIVITDHYYKDYFDRLGDRSWDAKVDCYLQGYQQAKEQGDKEGLQVFLGAEFTFEFSPNDYLIYGITEAFLKKHPMLYELGMPEFYRLAKENGLLVFQAHPFRPYLTPERPEFLDGVEVYNGNPRHNSRNEMALDYAIEHHLHRISGSDCHQPCDVARGGIVLEQSITTQEELLCALTSSKAKLIREGGNG